ncbi:hypothetical protein HNQ93_000336 [Hymenobacter luteus]|uniref:Esterase-like activity of phytase family protein n=2 Tax=Hymenobacter TaxID=89966 RepID=A0A7W9SXH3_9BACT|nr:MULTISPECIES: hypothetical protein [Hymenobacter]MBB4600184.1 hypothetical protein [Hymenobacter latericoloratus]MBB6057506.1 hypothetical protein [Hymenobacter luteus]
MLCPPRLVPFALCLLPPLLTGCSSDQGRGGFASVNDQYEIEEVGRLNREQVAESSGLAIASPEGDLWTHADGGNTARLYKITRQGDLLQTLNLEPLQNIDWEDLAQDDEHRLYLGDFGNNQNKRRNLCIYRLSGPTLQQADTIRFRYADQHEFPPRKPRRNFDCEAFYYYQDSLYLFTKNRGESRWLKQYVLPARPGRHTARLADSLQLPTWVTSADISPDGKRVALLGAEKVYLFERLPGRRLFDGLKSTLDTPGSGQTEAVVFVADQNFVFSNEKGKLFLATRKQ